MKWIEKTYFETLPEKGKSYKVTFGSKNVDPYLLQISNPVQSN